MDDRGWSWPAWKFGMKREDLFTTLHDQYNTFSSSIQDPEAFHHDVWEISNAASTQNEFHTLLADRKELRLRELNETLESASFEIIANPKLIGTEQWQYAIQLFRSRSLDSLVRYFASYLPDTHPWHQTQDDVETSTTTSSISDSASESVASVDSVSTHGSKPFFDDMDHEYLTHEPLTIHTSIPPSHLPPSPRSMTLCTDSSSTSPIDNDHGDHLLGVMTPARTMSFSDDEADSMTTSAMLSKDDEDDTSQTDDADTPFSSISDIAHVAHCQQTRHESITPAECDDVVEGSEELESETPTPRNEAHLQSYPLPDHNSKSTDGMPSAPLYKQVLHDYVRSSRKGRKDSSPTRSVRRTSPEIGRIHKPLLDTVRTRPHGRRRND